MTDHPDTVINCTIDGFCDCGLNLSGVDPFDFKGDCGLDHYEVRGWDGWHRHMAFVIWNRHLRYRRHWYKQKYEMKHSF